MWKCGSVEVWKCGSVEVWTEEAKTGKSHRKRKNRDKAPLRYVPPRVCSARRSKLTLRTTRRMTLCALLPTMLHKTLPLAHICAELSFARRLAALDAEVYLTVRTSNSRFKIMVFELALGTLLLRLTVAHFELELPKRASRATSRATSVLTSCDLQAGPARMPFACCLRT